MPTIKNDSHILINQLKDIEWFKNLGKQTSISDAAQVDSKILCEQYYTSIDWENATLEMQNALTIYLHTKFNKEYQYWNKTVEYNKSILNEELLPIIGKIQIPFNDKKIFYECVRWDVLGLLMEHSYRDFRIPTNIKRHLILEVYRKGHFPCGWLGNFPKGKLLFY